jgi:hypothetical protein
MFPDLGSNESQRMTTNKFKEGHNGSKNNKNKTSIDHMHNDQRNQLVVQ